jgi:trimeric autotransporter adhesin
VTGSGSLGTVAGFASPPGVTEAINLTGVAFNGNTTRSFTENATGTSGVLTVTNGSQTANITLLGSYTTANFTIASNGAGGTLVTDPPTLVGSASNPVLAAHG